MSDLNVAADKIVPNKSQKVLVIIGLMLGIIFSELDETVVITAMPTIIHDLGGLSLYGWVTGLYMLALSAFMPILGKLADLYGRRKIYLLSITLFMGGSMICGFSNSMGLLLVGRSIQGIGAGGLMPLAMMIIGSLLPVEQRAKIQGFMGTMMFIPILLGPFLGGFLVDHFSWHAIFFINIPIGLLAACFVLMGLKEDPLSQKVSIDWAGAVLLMLAIVSLLIPPVLVENEGFAWGSPLILGMFGLGVLLLALFIWVETKVQQPIVPLHLFKNRNIMVMSALVFTVGIGCMGAFSTFPYYAQNVLELTPTYAGYLTVPLMVGAILSSILCGYLFTRIPYRNLIGISLLLPIVGFYLFTQLSLQTSIFQLVFYMMIIGLGLGALFGGDNLIIQESVAEKDQGVALATVPLFQSIGTTIGVSLFGNLLSSSITSQLQAVRQQLPESMAHQLDQLATGGIPKSLSPELLASIKMRFVESFQSIYSFSLATAVIAFLLAWFLKKEVLTSKNKREESK